MRGVIKEHGHDGRRYIIVEGEDGFSYFIGIDKFADRRQYKKYSWKGNSVVFDIDESPDYETPHGKNAVLVEMKDPYRHERIASRIASQKAHEENVEKKRVARERQERLEERAAAKREYESANTWYLAQKWKDGEWVTVQCFKTREEAVSLVSELKTKGRGRFIKRVGLTMTVRCGK